MKAVSNGCIAILRKLRYHKIVGGKHTPEAFCLRLVKHLPKQEHKDALKDWEWCIKEGLVLTKPTHSGRHVSLNPKRIGEIYDMVK